MEGQYSHPARIVAFNTAEGWSRDATMDIADELRRRFAEYDEVPISVQECVASAEELTPMDAHLVEATIKAYLTEIRNRLDKAAGIGRAADACAGAGFHEKGLEVALDIEQLLYEATTLLNAASLINRIARQS